MNRVHVVHCYKMEQKKIQGKLNIICINKKNEIWYQNDTKKKKQNKTRFGFEF